MDAWRTIDDRLNAWFAAPTHSAGAALLPRIVAMAGRVVDVDVRAGGVRVRLDREDASLAPAISAAADDLGLSPAPASLQALRVVLETPDPDRAAPFWALALGYDRDRAVLRDPWRRDLPLVLEHDREARPLRDRIHVDVVRPAAAIQTIVDALGPASGPYGLRHADPDGIEVDAVPGEPLAGAEDWWTLFAAVARYATTTEQTVALAERAAGLADEADERLGIDVRPGSVTLDGGKDAWEDDAGARPAFVALAAAIQRAAHDLGAASLPADLRFVQLGFDAVDVAGSRAIWRAVLAAERDPREHVTDLVDPLGLGHVLFVQDMDAHEAERRAQRPRVRVEVLVPADALEARLDAVVAAGGRVLEQRDGRATIADADGAIAVVVAG
ncbi:VOC family protein [Agrococcus jejuensis]|uniref:Glyoxalase-like domain-containing protein n=1 Tax=Agrococcus jejuensis TaxID=399736 RepID=A0A1G8G0F4_9MICO|nr:VOC family protein [Agrococcus jejuensis]SDH87868.1 hypothetical protein SAMN04489720_2702 [Agrococcus jejuensis]